MTISVPGPRYSGSLWDCHDPLVPTQLLEAGYILVVMLVLFAARRRRRFYGQLFLMYLVLYAAGRFILEYFRGDTGRGFVVENYMSHSQFIALCVIIVVLIIYAKAAGRAMTRMS